jgi:hypothetical protein
MSFGLGIPPSVPQLLINAVTGHVGTSLHKESCTIVLGWDFDRRRRSLLRQETHRGALQVKGSCGPRLLFELPNLEPVDVRLLVQLVFEPDF